MNEGLHQSPVVEAILPDGTIIQVRLAAGSSGGIASTGLAERLDLQEALDVIGKIAAVIRRSLDPELPTRATATFGIAFSLHAGRLTSLLVDTGAEASVSVTLEWEWPEAGH
jgi:Trypsin-co-occurring domain 1